MLKQSGGAGRRTGGGFEAIAMTASLLLILFCGYMMQYRWFPDGLLPKASKAAQAVVTEVAPTTDVHISEVMSSNRMAYADENGVYPDWVEITNVGRSPVNISGWTLTDKAKGGQTFEFPEVSIAPGEYIVVFASNSLLNTPGQAYHAPFKLSSSGDAVMLFNAEGTAVESINIPAMGVNQSYAVVPDSQKWVITEQYTPGLPNTPDSFALLNDHTYTGEVTLYVNEFCADNDKGIKDASGEHHDWCELYNAGDQPVSLKGYSLSDDANKMEKWRFPDVTIGAGEYLIVFLSGKDADIGGELHASFKLAAEGEVLLLVDPQGKILSQASFDNVQPDTSMVRQPDGSYKTSGSPTPGQANG